MKTKYKVINDLFETYTNRTIIAQELINDFISVAEYCEDADLIGHVKSLKPQDAVDFIAEIWHLELEKL